MKAVSIKSVSPVAPQNLHSNPRYRRQRGDFMVSLTIALIIVSVISIGAYIAFRDNTRKNETREAITRVNNTSGLLRSNFGVNNMYGTVTTAVAVQSRTIPEDQRIPGTTTAQNAFGGAVTVTPVTLSSTNDGVSLQWDNVPPNNCGELVLGTQATSRRISVGGTTVKPLDGAINVATLNTACDAAAPVAIIWDIGRTGT